MTKTRSSPSRSEAKAISSPSGDQAGDQSLAGFRVRFTAPEPSGATTEISSSTLTPARRVAVGDVRAVGRPVGVELSARRLDERPPAGAVRADDEEVVLVGHDEHACRLRLRAAAAGGGEQRDQADTGERETGPPHMRVYTCAGPGVPASTAV